MSESTISRQAILDAGYVEDRARGMLILPGYALVPVGARQEVGMLWHSGGFSFHRIDDVEWGEIVRDNDSPRFRPLGPIQYFDCARLEAAGYTKDVSLFYPPEPYLTKVATFPLPPYWQLVRAFPSSSLGLWFFADDNISKGGGNPSEVVYMKWVGP